MTLIVSWIGVDKRKNGNEVSSIYISADSRYTWEKSIIYDHGIKVFGSTKFPEIFGFCGDVLFPFIVLGQLIAQIDNGIILENSDNTDIKSCKIFSFINASFKSYPKSLIKDRFTILHGTRFEKTFKLYKIHNGKDNQLYKDEIPLGDISTKVFSDGSGAIEFNQNWSSWTNKHNNYGTSRAVYHCLYKTLKNIKDPCTGGFLQIVALYRKDNTRLIGIIENGEKYIYGKECLANIVSSKIEWRNENFERVDPKTLKLLEGAQRQPS